MSNSLVYVFLNDKFCALPQTQTSSYSYQSVPEYYLDTLNYNRKKFDNTYLISHSKEIETIKKTLGETNITYIDVDQEIVPTDEFKQYIEVLNAKWSRYRIDPFWFTTFARVIVLTIAVKKFNIENTIHIEADNIIFANDFTKINSLFSAGDFGWCNEAPNSSAPSLIYIKDAAAGDTLYKLHIKLLNKGEQVIRPYVGHFAPWITDMAFLDLIRKGSKQYKMLPCVPLGEYSKNFETVQAVFDPTSYGQFLGGTNNGHPEGYCEYRHFVGKEIIDKNIEVKFNKEPFIVYKGINIPIFNLHVHNKKKIKHFLNI
jgi:hypothetical protein